MCTDSYYYGYYGTDSSEGDPIATAEDACGAPVGDLNSSEYLTLFSDTIAVLVNDETEPFEATIAEEDIETECQVSSSRFSRSCCVPMHLLSGYIHTYISTRKLFEH